MARLSIHMLKCHIVGNHMHWLIYKNSDSDTVNNILSWKSLYVTLVLLSVGRKMLK